MKSKKNNIEISEKDVDEQLVDIPTPEPTKQKKILTPEQLENLKKARERASERKKELAQLNAKSKGLKEEKLKADAAEYDKLQKQKELEESIKKIEEANAKPPQKKTEHHKKIKKIIYEDETEDENSSVEEVIVKKKKQPKKKEPTYTELMNKSAEQQIKEKLQEERIKSLYNQLTGKVRIF
jgi:hypothetical protein